MKVCVLQPDYRESTVGYKDYDPPRDLSPLLPEARVDHVFLRKAAVYGQLKALASAGYDIFVNLCEGYLEWDVPSIDVIWSLDRLRLPYTGPDARHYDPPKSLMKYVAHCHGVRFPPFVEARCEQDIASAVDQLRFPLFVKPAHSGDSQGVNRDSLVESESQLRHKCGQILEQYGGAMIEEYVPGRECTVLVAANPNDAFAPLALAPIEFIFPAGEPFKTYSLKIESYNPDRNVPVSDPDLDRRLREAAREMFIGFEGVGYARLDFRINDRGEIFFLDINFTCSVFYPEGSEGSADYILHYDPMRASGFLRHIIAEGQARYARRWPKYERHGQAIAGFGIRATQPIRAGEIVYGGEMRSHRLVTRSWIESNWPADRIAVIGRYAIPVSADTYIVWDEDPEQWAPQNHSCEPNTAYRGLNLVALRDIRTGEEITLDYGALGHTDMTPFTCVCGSPACRGRIG